VGYSPSIRDIGKSFGQRGAAPTAIRAPNAGRIVGGLHVSTSPRIYGGNRHRINGDRSGARHHTAWNGNRLLFSHRQWECDESAFSGDCTHHLVVLTDAGHTRETSVRDESRLIYSGRDYPGALSFVPAEIERRCSYRRVSMSYSALWIHPDFVAKVMPRPNDIAQRVMINGQDARVASLLGWLRDEVVSTVRTDDFLAEHIAGLILFRLAALDGGEEPIRRGRLNGRRLRTTEDFIEANLAENISLSELAARAEMPLGTFVRHFRRSTGQSPYAFIIERRLRRAEMLMRESNATIAEIAFACGFSSQSHFTSVFRLRRGATPGAWRAQFSSRILTNSTES
jgi:AraC family transcriptional regulator